jgi:glycosyltransferase involved in cell wall biosynthesis
MPVYNMAQFIREAILSILDQTYADFELLVVDDASSDNTCEIIKSLNDDRITLVRNDSNRGLVYSLNFGLDYFDCEYVLRMDGDDVSLPDRFEKQVRFMDQNPGVVLCGTQAYWEEMDADLNIGNVHEWDYYLNDQDLRVSLIWGASFIHPSVIIRNHVLKSNNLIYDNTFTIACEDWHMWVRLSRFGKIANLNERLVRYRIRKGSLHRSDPSLALKLNHQVRQFYLHSFGLDESVIKTILNAGEVKSNDFNDLIFAYRIFLQKASGKLDINCLRTQIGNRLVDAIKNNKLNVFYLFKVIVFGFRPDATYLKKALRYSLSR